MRQVGILFVILFATGVSAVRSAGPIDVGSRKQLFVDDRFIAQSRGIELMMNAPVKMNQPVLDTDVSWEGEAKPSVGWYSSVIKEGDKIRIWGAGMNALPVRMASDGPVVNLFAYAESRDGIHFTRPDPSLVAYDESQAEIGKHGRIGGVSVWIDPKAPPAHRYKTQAKYYPPDGKPAEFHMYSSPDGYRWTFFAKSPVGTCDTQSIAFWDEAKQKYLLYTRENIGSGTPARRRVIRRLESLDLLRWDHESIVLEADDIDNRTYQTPTPQPPVDYYGGNVFRYPDDAADSPFIMIAHAFWHWQRRPEKDRAGGYSDHKFRIEVLAPATLDDRLLVSRDGIHFSRPGDRKPFISVGLTGSFASRRAWSLPNPVRMGNELWIYYYGENRDHDGFVEPAASTLRCAIDRAILRLDGFVSADAAYTGGEIVTPLITFAGNRLELNVDPGGGGSVRVELLDENDRPINGYRRDEATPLFENSVCLPVTWGTNAGVAPLAGKPIRIRFLMRDCKLYAFQFVTKP